MSSFDAAAHHYRLAKSHLRAAETYPVTVDGDVWMDHANRLELMLGAVAHGLLFVGVVGASAGDPKVALANCSRSLRDALAERD